MQHCCDSTSGFKAGEVFEDEASAIRLAAEAEEDQARDFEPQVSEAFDHDHTRGGLHPERVCALLFAIDRAPDCRGAGPDLFGKRCEGRWCQQLGGTDVAETKIQIHKTTSEAETEHRRNTRPECLAECLGGCSVSCGNAHDHWQAAHILGAGGVGGQHPCGGGGHLLD